MLTLRNVRAGYGGAEVLHGIDLTLTAGRSTSLLGPNGCGKTTLLRAMAALIPYTGEIKLRGRDISLMRREEIASRVAVMSQLNEVSFPYTARETVLLGRYPRMKKHLFASPSKRDIEYAEECMRRVNVDELRDRPINALSGGQRQRVFLAKALAQEPDIILLDEPTNHLDIRHQIALIDFLKEWVSAGDRAVVGVFHDINLALRLTEDAVFLKDGQIVGRGAFDEVAGREFLKTVYQTDIVGFMQSSLKKWEDK